MSLRLFGLLLTVTAASMAATPAAAAVFKPETMTLANGLQLVVVPNHRAPVVSHMVFYKVGATDEPEGQSGLAHLLEHLMFKGTATVPAGDFSRRIGRVGGDENAMTTADYTTYFQDIARTELPLVMALEADRMRNLTLSDADVAPEREVVLEERRLRVDNDPAALLAERATATLYLNHPYRRPVLGWEHEVAALTAADAQRFYRRWYAPNNAIVVIAGDVTLAEAQTLAEKIYGPLTPIDLPERLDLRDPPPLTNRRVVLADPRVNQPAWQRTYPAPGYRCGDTAQAYPLQILAAILGDPTGRLNQALVWSSGEAIEVGADYDPSRRGPAEFVLFASPSDGIGLARLESRIDAEVRHVLQRGVSTDEVERGKRRLLAEAVYARDSLDTAPTVLGEALAIGQTIDDVEAWPERISAVTPAAVDAAARAVLGGLGSVTALLETDSKESPARRSVVPKARPTGSPASIPASLPARVR